MTEVAIRDSVLGRTLFSVIAAWALIFAVDCICIGEKVTSKQWTYLMGFPGGKWFWAALFGVPAMTALTAVLRRRHHVAAASLFVIGCGGALIAVFYLLAPLIDPGLLTLGYMPWLLAPIFGYPCALWSWSPVRWY